MFQEYYRDRAPEQLAKEFGPQFALAVAKLEPGSWQGPVQSGLGWHLVFIDTAVAGARAGVRGSRSGGQDRVARRAEGARVAEGVQGHAGEVHGAAAGGAGDAAGRCRPRRRPPTALRHRPPDLRRDAARQQLARLAWRCCSRRRSACTRRRPTSRGRRISRSRKPRRASTPCSGAPRCWRACGCRWC